jgi:ATP-dependent helicase/nuclease subunit B
LFALQDNGTDLLGDHALPAGVQYFPARVPLLKADGAMTDSEACAARLSEWKRKGLILNDESVLNAMENTEKPIRMPFTRRKDGTLAGNLADHEQFAQLKKFVFKRVGKMVDEIASGNVNPNPYTRGTSFNACTFCPYGAICHKTVVSERRDYRAISDKEFWNAVEKEVGSDG